MVTPDHDRLLGLVSNITTAMHPGWDYGAYVNYPDDRLRDCTCIRPTWFLLLML